MEIYLLGKKKIEEKSVQFRNINHFNLRYRTLKNEDSLRHLFPLLPSLPKIFDFPFHHFCGEETSRRWTIVTIRHAFIDSTIR